MKFSALGKTFYFGKSAEAVKQAYSYGAYQNTFADLLSGSGLLVSVDSLYTIYNNVVDIKKAIYKKQQATAREGFTFVDPIDETKEASPKLAKEAAQLIDSSTLSFNELKSKWQKDRNVSGNVYIHIEENQSGKALGLNVIDPRTMTIKADQYGNIKEYKQQVMGVEGQSFTPEEIVHDKFDESTKNPIFGCSPIEEIVWEAKGEMAAQMQNYFFYENNAVPSHLLILEENLGQEQIDEVKRQTDKRFKGAEQRWKTGVIPFVKDIKTISFSQKEMQFIENREFSTKKVVVAFQVPSALLGYTEGVQRGNMQVIWKDFYENTIRPDERRLEEIINKQLLPKLGFVDSSGSLTIKFKIKSSNYDDKFAIQEQNRKDVLSGVMTPNEARQARNLPESDNPLADELAINGIMLDDLRDDMKEAKKLALEKQKAEIKKISNLLN